MEDIKREIRKLLCDLTNHRNSYLNEAVIYKKRYFYYKVTITIISILSPALITYQAFVERDSIFAFLSIIITAIGGATATLHSVFNYNEISIKNLNSYLNTDDLLNKAESEFEKLEQLHATNDKAIYKEYINLKENTNKDFIQIKRNHFETEWSFIKERTEHKS